MSKPLEEIKPDQFNQDFSRLFKIESHVEEVKMQEIEDLIVQFGNREREIQFGRKVAQFNSRILNQLHQNSVSEEKANILLQTRGLHLESIAAACQVAGAVFGAPMIGQALATPFTSAANYQGQVTRSKEEILSHFYQRLRDVISEFNPQMQSADKEIDQAASMIDRMIQNLRRMGEMIFGG